MLLALVLVVVVVVELVVLVLELVTVTVRLVVLSAVAIQEGLTITLEAEDGQDVLLLQLRRFFLACVDLSARLLWRRYFTVLRSQHSRRCGSSPLHRLALLPSLLRRCRWARRCGRLRSTGGRTR
jgi:hypothetical protein